VSHRSLRVAACALSLAGVLALTGCSNSAQEPSAPVAKSAEEQIKAIQNNPNMPQAAKDAAIAQIRTRNQQGVPQPAGAAQPAGESK